MSPYAFRHSGVTVVNRVNTLGILVYGRRETTKRVLQGGKSRREAYKGVTRTGSFRVHLETVA